MLDRAEHLTSILGLLSRHPVVGLVGARQVGKTTLARAIAKRFSGRRGTRPTVFDLENPEHLHRLADPMLALRPLRGLVVIDEVHRAPGLFEILRVLVDRVRQPARFLVLGSASPEILRQGSETLAGRIAYYELPGLSLAEVGEKNYKKLWLRGGFPRSFTARSHSHSFEWRAEFMKTFLERDLPELGIGVRSTTMRRFWSMLAHYHAQTWNGSEFARAFGVADTTVRNYLDILISALVVRQLQPWHANISKRQVKSPKVYIADTGVLHALLNLRNMEDLEGHPKVGASWESFVIEELIRRLGVRREECFHWATHAGAELDLLIMRGRTRLGFEIKRTTSPRITKSMSNAVADLGLKRLEVIHAGEETFQLSKKIRAVPLTRIVNDIPRLR